MALIDLKNRVVVDQNFDITDSPITKLRTNQEQPAFHNLPCREVKLLFVEGSKMDDEAQPFTIPTNNVWIKSCASSKEQLEEMLLFPHLHVPRILYSLNPQIGLKLAIQHIFQVAYGLESMLKVVQQLFVTESYMFKGFEMFNKINISLWKGATPQIPPQMADTFSHQILASRSQILTETGRKHLHFTSSTRKEIGLFLDNTTALKPEVATKVLKFITRSNPVSMLASFYAQQCLICTADFESHTELQSHFAECASGYGIKASGLEEQLTYTCKTCSSEPMTYGSMIGHIYSFCAVNFRATCPYCNAVSRACQCCKNKLDQAKMLDSIRHNCKPYDLLHDRNIFYLVLWLESTRVCGAVQGENVQPPSLTDFDFDMVMQISNKSLFIMIRTITAHLNVDIETVISVLDSENVNVANLKTLHKGKVDYTKEPPPTVCNMCWEVLSGPLGQHLSATHPRCYCNDKSFQNVGELMEHFKTHSLRNQICPVCPVKFENIFHAISHLENHKSSVLQPKSKCDIDLGLPLCAQLSVDGFEHLRHILTYHITDREYLRCVLTNSLKFVQGYFSVGQSDPSSLATPPLGLSSAREEHLVSQPTQSGVKLAENIKLYSRMAFKCPNEECLVQGIVFMTQIELDSHIKVTHRCIKPSCSFSSPDSKTLWAHVENHVKNFGKVYVCTICNQDFPDEMSLRSHNTIAHYLRCDICGDTSHKSRASLNEHMKNCNTPEFPTATQSGSQPQPGSSHSFPLAVSGQPNNQQPLLLLVDALAATSIADKTSLQNIKSIIMRQDTLNRNIETRISGDKTFVETPVFSTGNPLSIPNSRLKDLPKFNPVDDKPLCNYVSFTTLITELNCLATEFHLTESQYVNLLLQQFGSIAKAHLKSILNVTTDIRSVPLERVLETARVLFYDVDLSSIYTQSTNLHVKPGESIIAFFARADTITKLASYYLDDPAQIESFRASNLRLQFLNAVGKNFSDFIRKKEMLQLIIYTPTELLRIFLEWSKSERADNPPRLASINNVNDLSLDNIIPGAKPSRGKAQNRYRGRGRGRNDRGANTSTSDRTVNQVATPNSRNSGRSQSLPPIKYKESSQQKRRALNITSDEVHCFLCGGQHFPRQCTTYPGARVQDTPCSQCRYYHESDACKSRRNSGLRSGSSHN